MSSRQRSDRNRSGRQRSSEKNWAGLAATVCVVGGGGGHSVYSVFCFCCFCFVCFRSLDWQKCASDNRVKRSHFRLYVNCASSLLT